MNRHPHPDALAALYRALGDPTRLRILRLLQAGDLCVHRLCDALEMRQPAVSHQLRVLRDRGLVLARRDGREVFYRIRDRALAHLASGPAAAAAAPRTARRRRR